MSENIKKPIKMNWTLASILTFVAAPISIFFYTALTSANMLALSFSFMFIMAFIVAFVLIMASHGQKPAWLIGPFAVLFVYYFAQNWSVMTAYFPENIVMSFLGFAAASMMVVSFISYLIVSVGKVSSRKPYYILLLATLALIVASALAQWLYEWDGFTLWSWVDQLLFLGGVIMFLWQLSPKPEVSKENRYALKRVEAAYREGILTPEEYQAKKDALVK